MIHSDTGRLRSLPYRGDPVNLAGGDDGNDEDETVIKVDNTPLPNWNTNVRLAECYSNNTAYRVHYTSPSMHEIVEYTAAQGGFNGT